MITQFTSLKDAQSELIINRSRFLGFSFYVKDEIDVQSKLDQLKSRFFDANHICYAYILHPNQNNIRFSDDREPNGTAGIPILEAIKGKKLSQTLVAVVRYFGGIKLGKGGLSRAYCDSAVMVLDQSEKITFTLCNIIRFNCAFITLKRIQSLPQSKIISTEFSKDVNLTLALKHSLDYQTQIQSITQTNTKITLLSQEFLPLI